MKYEYNLGKVLLTPRGDYSNSEYYEPLDFVVYNNSSYVAKVKTNGHLPTETAFWQLLASGPDASNFVPSTRTINGHQLSSDFNITASDVGALSDDVTIPTSLSQLQQDTGHRTVTDTEKNGWSNKADKVSNAIEYDIVSLDSNGNLLDSGINVNDIQIVPSVFTDNNIVVFDGGGYIEDSGISSNNIIQKSLTTGLLKNDGTVDQTQYGTYSKPSGGIPASDLASGVIPAVPVQDVTVGGTSVLNNGVAVIPDINDKADKVVVVDASTLPSTLDPNKVYLMGALTGTVNIPEFTSIASGDTEAKIWCFTFNTSTTAPNINWPTGITKWAGGSLPTINASKYYEVTAMDGIGVIIESSAVSS